MSVAAEGAGEPALPNLWIDSEGIERNAARIVARVDLEIVGVTKGVCGNPRVARAMLAGGSAGIADSRVTQIVGFRERLDCDTLLLRAPMGAECPAVVENATWSMVSEPATLRALSTAANERGVVHRALLAIDVGDRREGVLPEDLDSLLETAIDLPEIEVAGLATHVGSFGGIVPTGANVGRLVELVERSEERLGRRPAVVSGGSTNALGLAFDGGLPERVTQLRVGEGILLGGSGLRRGDRGARDRRDQTGRGGHRVQAEAVRAGRRNQPGRVRARAGVRDCGVRRRAILALGRQDCAIDGLIPLEEGIEVIGASSDHTVVDVTDARGSVEVGDSLAFRPGYAALARAAVSPYVAIEVG